MTEPTNQKVELTADIPKQPITSENTFTNDQTISTEYLSAIAHDHNTLSPTKEQAEFTLDPDINPNGISTFMASFLNLRGLIGIGILAMPSVMKNFGIYASLIVFPLVAACIIWALDLFSVVANDAQYYKPSLEGLSKKVLGRFHQILTGFSNQFFNFGVSGANVIFSVNFVNYAMCQMGGSLCGHKFIINLIGLIICLPTALIHDMKYFKYLATICICFIFSAIFVISFWNIREISLNGVDPNFVKWNWLYWPEFFGVVLFSLEGVGTLMPIRATMKHRKHFRPMFGISLSFIVVLLLVFGVICEQSLGLGVKDIVFMNFPETMTFIYVLQILYAFGCVITFPMYVNVVASIIFQMKGLRNQFKGNHRYRNCSILRAFLIVLLFGLSMSGINIIDLLGLTGSLCNAYLAIILPNLLFVRHFEKKGTLTKGKNCICWVYIIVGTTFCFVSVGFSIKDMIVRFLISHK